MLLVVDKHDSETKTQTDSNLNLSIHIDTQELPALTLNDRGIYDQLKPLAPQKEGTPPTDSFVVGRNPSSVSSSLENQKNLSSSSSSSYDEVPTKKKFGGSSISNPPDFSSPLESFVELDNSKNAKCSERAPSPLYDDTNCNVGSGVESEKTRPVCKEVYSWYVCPDCNKAHSRPHTCNQRYGRCCAVERKKRAYKRLTELKIRSKRLIHIVIGFRKQKGKPNKERKKEMETGASKFHRKARKMGYKFIGLRIYDLADDGNFDHFHYAIIPEKKFMNHRTLNIDVNKLRKELTKSTKGFANVIKVFGFKSKKNLLWYFAKRIAGIYGHKSEKNLFFLEDLMTYQEYHKLFFRVRTVVIIGRIPGGICSINARSGVECPYCHSKNVYKIMNLPDGEIYDPKDHPPPEIYELTAQDLKISLDFIRETEGVKGFEDSNLAKTQDEIRKSMRKEVPSWDNMSSDGYDSVENKLLSWEETLLKRSADDSYE